MAKRAEAPGRFGVIAVITAILVAVLAAVVPAHAATTPNHEWQIPAPALLPDHGAAAPNAWPNCHVQDIRASARTTRSTYAVLGVVRLRGHHCLIHVANRVVALLDTNGHPLNVAIRSASAANQGDNPPPRNGTDAVAWGFAWRGSWCGAQAVYIRIELSGNRVMRIPLPGGKPDCVKGGGKPVVIRGSFGSPGEPVQTAPLEWSSLKAKLHVNPTVPGSTLRGLSVTFTNRSPDAITLDPCPHYTLTVASKHASEAAVPSGALTGCPSTPSVVPGNGSKVIHLDAASFNRKDFGSPGTNLTVTFGMAGLAPSAERSRLA